MPACAHMVTSRRLNMLSGVYTHYKHCEGSWRRKKETIGWILLSWLDTLYARQRTVNNDHDDDDHDDSVAKLFPCPWLFFWFHRFLSTCHASMKEGTRGKRAQVFQLAKATSPWKWRVSEKETKVFSLPRFFLPLLTKILWCQLLVKKLVGSWLWRGWRSGCSVLKYFLDLPHFHHDCSPSDTLSQVFPASPPHQARNELAFPHQGNEAAQHVYPHVGWSLSIGFSCWG